MRLTDKDALMADIERTIEESGCVNHEGEIMDCVQYAPAIEPKCGECEQFKATLTREGFDDIETMIAKYKTVMLAANEISLQQGEETEELRWALTESQRRERAAVDAIYKIAACDACKHYDPDDNSCAKPSIESHECFEWRGPAGNEDKP